MESKKLFFFVAQIKCWQLNLDSPAPGSVTILSRHRPWGVSGLLTWERPIELGTMETLEKVPVIYSEAFAVHSVLGGRPLNIT